MARTTASTGNPEAYVNEALENMEEKRTEELQRAQEFYVIKLDQMEKELERITQKLGLGSERAQKLTSAITDIRNMVNSIDLQTKILKNYAAPFDIDSWRVQGVVTGPDGNPSIGLSVFIASGKQEANRSELSAQTDELGFYSITVDKTIIEQLKAEETFLWVSQENKIIYKTSKPLMPIESVIDVVNVLID